ncbi:diaminopimelate decarboxylase [Salmonella enterica subsp. enterica serovar Newport]|nr:diaminopimelate decarboxylase [Salmonella enterica]EII7447581.1 diaminopimelate decarboxylase [Salmonella enterica subsp. enterica serovar Newport]
MNTLHWIKSSIAIAKTPFYLYNEELILENIQKLKNCFHEKNYKILYAIKANSNMKIIKIVTGAGLGVDTCSVEEIKLSLLCGINKQEIYYNADCLTPEEIDFAVRYKINLTLGSIDALKYVISKYPGISVALRINTGIGAGHSDKVITNGEYSKFGLHISEVEYAKLLCKSASIKICGLHTHTGSGDMNISSYNKNARILAGISTTFPDLDFLNFGGGFGFDYKGNEEYNINGIHKELNKIRFDFNIPEHVCFIVEPGRYIVANTGVLISEVSSVKNHPTRNFIGLNTGYNHFPRCFYYGAWHNILNITSKDEAFIKYDIVGNLCQSGDIFARDRLLSKTYVGDLICIMDVGAYGFSMSSNFNSRVKPGEFLIEVNGNVKMIRRPEKFEDIVSTFILD